MQIYRLSPVKNQPMSVVSTCVGTKSMQKQHQHIFNIRACLNKSAKHEAQIVKSEFQCCDSNKTRVESQLLIRL